MANPFKGLGISDEDLKREIESSAEVRAAQMKRAKEVATYAKSIAPKDTGHYAAGIEVQKTKTGKIRVVATAWYSHLIEYGTKADKKGADKRRYRKRPGVLLGPNTPTPEFAIFAKTAANFGGTAGGVLSDDG
jgi:hypothetical protein